MTLEEKRERNKEMIRRFSEGTSLIDLMRDYKFRSILTVKKIVTGKIVCSEKKPKQYADIIADIEIGMDVYDVADKHNCNSALVMRIIKKAGIKTKDQILKEYRNEQIIKLASEHVPFFKIKEQTGLSIERIRLICREHGVLATNNKRERRKLYQSLLPKYIEALKESDEKVKEVLGDINRKSYERWLYTYSRIKLGPIKKQREEQKILALFKQGNSVTSIMKEFKCCRNKIYRVLHYNGIVLQEPNIKERNEQIRLMYRDEIGITTTEIGKIFGMTAANVSLILLDKHIAYSHEEYLKKRERIKKINSATGK